MDCLHSFLSRCGIAVCLSTLLFATPVAARAQEGDTLSPEQEPGVTVSMPLSSQETPEPEPASPDTDALADEAAPLDEVAAAEEALPDASDTAPDATIGEPLDSQDEAQQLEAQNQQEVQPMAPEGWVHEGNDTFYYRNGERLTGEVSLVSEDGSASAWYYFYETGALARGVDLYISGEDGADKWVRCGADGVMATGEQFANDPAAGHVGWYHFDEQTRAMSLGLTKLASGGGKTVYYDERTGVMRFGEIHVGGQDDGWYLFEEGTGAMARGWRFLGSGAAGKWVYYDPKSGRMCTGEHYVTDGEHGWCNFDPTTGAATFGWAYVNGKWHLYDPQNARMWFGERYVTLGQPGWCYFDDVDGSLQFGFKYIPQHDKWVFYDRANGRMHMGEEIIDGGWYLFEQGTGAAVSGWRFMPSNGGKWVYFDPIDKRMHFGEAHVTVGNEGWYLFDLQTGAMQRGWRYLASDGGKWVYYDPETGCMCKGERFVKEGQWGWYLFNTKTGAMERGLQYLPWSKKVCYYDRTNGCMRVGWQRFGNVSIYFDPATGAMQPDGYDVLARSTTIVGPSDADPAVASIIRGQNMSVRVIGDSISGGWGVNAPVICDGAPIAADAEGMRYEPSSATPMWANSLRNYVTSRGGTLFNSSVPTKGFGWFDALGAELPNNGLEHYDLTVFMLGTNDRSTNLEDLYRLVRRVLGKAQETSDRVVVVVPEPVGYASVYESGSASVGQVLRNVCAERGVPTIDALATFVPTASTAGYSNADLYSDGVHLTLVGQAVLWNIISRGLGVW